MQPGSHDEFVFQFVVGLSPRGTEGPTERKAFSVATKTSSFNHGANAARQLSEHPVVSILTR